MEFKKGDEVEVWDCEVQTPERAIFIAYDYVSDCEEFRYFVSNGRDNDVYKYCRPARPELKVDDPVWVREFSEAEWCPRHFSDWDDDGKIRCWEEGKTSHSSEIKDRVKVAWSQYRTTPPEGK